MAVSSSSAAHSPRPASGAEAAAEAAAAQAHSGLAFGGEVPYQPEWVDPSQQQPQSSQQAQQAQHREPHRQRSVILPSESAHRAEPSRDYTGAGLVRAGSRRAGGASGDGRDRDLELGGVTSVAASIHLERALSRGVDPARVTPRRKPWQVRVTPFEQVLNGDYDGSGTEDDPYLIDWLPAGIEQENPMKLPEVAKWTVAVFVSFATLAVSLSSSAYSGAIDSIRAEFPGYSTPEYTLGVSLFVLGFAIGPLFWAPLSELGGRRNLFLISYFFLTLWSGVAIASKNLESILVFRFLAGAFGSSPLTNAGGTLADVFTANERGLAMAVFASAPFLGPALGPITGGFLGEAAGWRWVFGYLTIFIGVVFFLGCAFLPETYSPVLLRRRAQMLHKATGKHFMPRMDKGRDVRVKTQFKIALSRPWQLLFVEPIVLLLSLYMAIVYAILYSLFAAFPIVFQVNRGWSPGIGGLAFLGVAVGIVLALLYIVFIENPRYIRESEKHGGTAPPESRLVAALIGAPLLTIGLAWFAASDAKSTPWIVPILGSAPFGAGMVLVFLAIQNYLVDAYLIYAASVLAASSVLRSLLGMAFPLFTPIQYENLGVQLGAMIPTVLSAVCLPMPFLFWKYGEPIRMRCKYSAEAARMYKIMAEGKSKSPDADAEGEGKGASAEHNAEKDEAASAVHETHSNDNMTAVSSASTPDRSSVERSLSKNTSQDAPHTAGPASAGAAHKRS